MFRKVMTLVVGLLTITLAIVGLARLLGLVPSNNATVNSEPEPAAQAPAQPGAIEITQSDGTVVEVFCHRDDEDRFALTVRNLRPGTDRFGVEVLLTTADGESQTTVADASSSISTATMFLLTPADHQFDECTILAIQDGNRLVRGPSPAP